MVSFLNMANRQGFANNWHPNTSIKCSYGPTTLSSFWGHLNMSSNLCSMKDFWVHKCQVHAHHAKGKWLKFVLNKLMQILKTRKTMPHMFFTNNSLSLPYSCLVIAPCLLGHF